MTFEVKCQMIWSGEGPLTHFTRIWPYSSMFPHVSSQLIWSWELPSTSLPCTHIGLLSCVWPQMCLHVGGFVVGLQAIVIGTVMNLGYFLNSTYFSYFYWQFQGSCGWWFFCWQCRLNLWLRFKTVIDTIVVKFIYIWFFFDSRVGWRRWSDGISWRWSWWWYWVSWWWGWRVNWRRWVIVIVLIFINCTIHWVVVVWVSIEVVIICGISLFIPWVCVTIWAVIILLVKGVFW